MDKYTIEQFEYRTDSIAVVESNTNAIICESTSIDDARLICKLLNENDKKVKIDKGIKKDIVEYLKDRKRTYQADEYVDIYFKYSDAIKAIESLEADDGK